ncbi:MAG: TIR domain-containing protein [Verrucomicrobiia bacterium]|jgi:predicted nucleotide-binding protein
MAYPVEVFGFGDSSFHAAERVAERLNLAQGEYLYLMPSHQDRAWFEPFTREEYEVDTLYGKFARFREERKGFHPFVIGIVHGTLSDKGKSVNMQYMPNEGVAVCTSKKWERESTEPVSAFLGYVFVHSAAVFAYPGKVMHPEMRNCLFDQKISSGLRKSMSSIVICDECADQLEKAVDPQTNAAIMRLLGALRSISQINSQPRPRVFIGSSSEGKQIAKYLQLGLSKTCDSTIWDQGVFGLSRGTLEGLAKAKSKFDYAILVLTPDDTTIKRGRRANSPRDNVLFELGFFMGALGQERTFMVHCDTTQIELPSDLAGVTRATFKMQSNGNLQATIGPVCTLIEQTIGVVQ